MLLLSYYESLTCEKLQEKTEYFVVIFKKLQNVDSPIAGNSKEIYNIFHSFSMKVVVFIRKKKEIYLIIVDLHVLKGTRLWRRGADSDGYVANFVESEQIIQLNGFTASFVQVTHHVNHQCVFFMSISFLPLVGNLSHTTIS